MIVGLETLDDAARAIATMQVRGAPLIGAAAAYGMALAVAEDPSDAGSKRRRQSSPRPVRPRSICAGRSPRCSGRYAEAPGKHRLAAALSRAGEIADADVAINRAIGEHGAALIAEAWQRKRRSRPRRNADPLQRRLARHRRLGHRARPDLPRPQ